jgi:pimeloyl-ACP methyl ester carboxylesterase
MLKTATFKGGKVAFSDRGKGRVVVLLHGFLGSHEIWESTIKNLSKSYRVISIDLPGHGGTDCFGYVHSMELMAKCVKTVLEQLKLKRYVIIGHSMGGYTALAFADLFPDHIRGICLYHSSGYADTPEKKRDRSRSAKVVKANPRIYITEAIKNLFATKNLKYLKKELAFATRIAVKTKKTGVVAALEGMKDRPARDIILRLVDYPVMMVIGELDNVLPHEQLLTQYQTIKNPSLLYLEHDGHMGFLESPRASNKALRKFLAKCFKKQ